MSVPDEKLKDKYDCVNGKVLLVCDRCGLLFCGHPDVSRRIPNSDLTIHECFACKLGGLK